MIEAVRRAINPQISQRDKDGEDDQIVMIEALSEGSYGKVPLGTFVTSICVVLCRSCVCVLCTVIVLEVQGVAARNGTQAEGSDTPRSA